jgi:hypothetical protein
VAQSTHSVLFSVMQLSDTAFGLQVQLVSSSVQAKQLHVSVQLYPPHAAAEIRLLLVSEQTTVFLIFSLRFMLSPAAAVIQSKNLMTICRVCQYIKLVAESRE